MDTVKEPHIDVEEPATASEPDTQVTGVRSSAVEVIEPEADGELHAVVTPDIDEPDRDEPKEPEPPVSISRLPGLARGSAAFGIYVVASILAFALPVITRLDSACVGICGSDSRLYIWSLRWMEYAIDNGLDPLRSDLVWAPVGMNLTWVTTLPGPSFVMIPITKAFGPLVSENLLLILAPALAAWAAYLVCHHVTRSFWASLAGGSLFGFSTYMVQHMRSHVNLLLIFFVPLAVYLVLRRISGSMPVWLFVPLLALVLVGQFSVSTELFATMTFFGGMAFVGAFLLGPREKRGRVLATMLWTGASYLLTAVAVYPFLSRAMSDLPDEGIRALDKNSSDLLSLIIPRHTLEFGGDWFRSFTTGWPALPQDDTAYLGIALIAMLVWFAWEGRRERNTWLLMGAIVVPIILSFGPILHVKGHRLIYMPGYLVEQMPLMKHALPERFPAYAALGVGVAAAIWIARSSGRRRWLRYGIVVLGALMLIRDGDAVKYHGDYEVPAFFTDGIYQRYLVPGETILAIPLDIGEELVWQVEADMSFKLARAYTGPLHPTGLLSIGRVRIEEGAKFPRQERVARFVIQRQIGAIVVLNPVPDAIRVTLESMTQSQGINVGGVTVYRIPEGGPYNTRGWQLDPAELYQEPGEVTLRS